MLADSEHNLACGGCRNHTENGGKELPASSECGAYIPWNKL